MDKEMALLLGTTFILTGLAMVLIHNDEHQGDILREEYRVYRQQMNVPLMHEIAYRPIHDELRSRISKVVNQKIEEYVFV